LDRVDPWRRTAVTLPTQGARTLLYHGVDQVGEQRYNSKFISEKTLYQQLLWLRDNAHIVPLSEQFEPQDSEFRISITFDDGFANLYTRLLPIVESLAIPVTVFVTTAGLCGRSFLWPDALDLLRFKAPKRVTIHGETFVKGRRHQYASVRTGHSLHAMLKQARPETIEDAIDVFGACEEALAAVHEDYWRLLNPTELRALADCPYIELGSHGSTHASFTAMSLTEVEAELRESKRYLETTCGAAVQALAYPDGRYSPQITELAERIGYPFQLAVDYAHPADAQDSRIQERLGMHPRLSWRNQVRAIANGRY